MDVTRIAEQFLANLPIENIRASSTNPRQHFDPAGLDELKASIAELGIQVPLLVRKMFDPDDGDLVCYELVAGERRLRAATELGLLEVPCLVREMSDAEARETQIVENLQRADVHPMEEADAYAALIHAAAWPKDTEILAQELTAEDVAKRVGKTAAYVAQRLKLRALEIDAKLLFSRGHLTLGHCLHLARLTPVDQERALRFMLDSDPKYDKRPITAIVRDRLGLPKLDANGAPEEKMADDDGEDDWVGADDDEGDAVSYNMPNPKVQKYMRFGRRIVEATEAQLKKWIESNVLLQLAAVPWRLDDKNLVPEAGACVTCPKRSGSNTALFGDLTAENDVCLDPKCFGAKQDACVKAHKAVAKSQEGKCWLLKISSKRSEAPLEEEAVGGGEVITRKTVKAGQWLPVEAGSCDNAVEGLMVDGMDKGKLVWCCADQKCKKHKHDVQRPYSGNSKPTSPAEIAKQKLEEQRQKVYSETEPPIRLAVFAALLEKVAPSTALLRSMVSDMLPNWQVAGIATCAGIEFKRVSVDESYPQNQIAEKAIKAYVAAADDAKLWRLAFAILHAKTAQVRPEMHSKRDEDRKPLWAVARSLKVDAGAIAKKMEGPSFAELYPNLVPNAKAAKKAAPAKAVVKKAKPKKAKLSEAKLSLESRKRIADAIKKRWTAARARAAKPAAKKAAKA
jgi:ParB/RepB/Spo0J family partition protein